MGSRVSSYHLAHLAGLVTNRGEAASWSIIAACHVSKSAKALRVGARELTSGPHTRSGSRRGLHHAACPSMKPKRSLISLQAFFGNNDGLNIKNRSPVTLPIGATTPHVTIRIDQRLHNLNKAHNFTRQGKQGTRSCQAGDGNLGNPGCASFQLGNRSSSQSAVEVFKACHAGRYLCSRCVVSVPYEHTSSTCDTCFARASRPYRRGPRRNNEFTQAQSKHACAASEAQAEVESNPRGGTMTGLKDEPSRSAMRWRSRIDLSTSSREHHVVKTERAPGSHLPYASKLRLISSPRANKTSSSGSSLYLENPCQGGFSGNSLPQEPRTFWETLLRHPRRVRQSTRSARTLRLVRAVGLASNSDPSSCPPPGQGCFAPLTRATPPPIATADKVGLGRKQNTDMKLFA